MLVVNKSPAGSWFTFKGQEELGVLFQGSSTQKSVFLFLSGPVFQKEASQCPQLSLAVDTADRQVLIIGNSIP